MGHTHHPWYQFPAFEYDRTPPWARTVGRAVEARARRVEKANILLVELLESAQLPVVWNLPSPLIPVHFMHSGR